MEHRGVDYRLLRTIAKQWRWEFAFGGVSKDGVSLSRTDAIFKAEKAIDAAIRLADGKVSQPSADADRAV